MSEFISRIPPNCADCQQVRYVTEHIKNHEEQKDEVTAAALSQDPDELALHIFNSVCNDNEGGEIEGGAEGISKKLRQKAAEALDVIDEHIEQLEVCGDELVLGCKGLLRMRATREGVTYLVNVCTSPVAPREKILNL